MQLTGHLKVTEAENREHDISLFAKRVVTIPSNLKERHDYDGRTDGQPVYMGFAPSGLAEGSNGWLIIKCTYDGSNCLTAKNVSRESLSTEPVGGTANWTARAGYTYE